MSPAAQSAPSDHDLPLVELPPLRLINMIERALELAFKNKRHTLRLLGVVDQAVADFDAGEPGEALDMLRAVQKSWPLKDRA